MQIGMLRVRRGRGGDVDKHVRRAKRGRVVMRAVKQAGMWIVVRMAWPG